MLRNLFFYSIFLLISLSLFGCIDITERSNLLDDVVHLDKELFSKLKLSQVEINLPSYEEDTLLELYKKKKYTKIINEASSYKTLAIIPFTKLYIIGMSYFHKKMYNRAIPYLLQSTKDKNTYVSDLIYYNLALSFYYTRKTSKAIYYFKLIRNNYPFFDFMDKVIDAEGKFYISIKAFSKLRREFLPFLKALDKLFLSKECTTKRHRVNIAKVKERLFYFIAYSYEKSRRYDTALYYYRRVIKLFRTYSYTKKAVQQLVSNKYKKKLGKKDLLYIARSYFKKRNYAKSITFLQKKINLNKNRKSPTSYSSFKGEEEFFFKNRFLKKEIFLYYSILFSSYNKKGQVKRAYITYKNALASFNKTSVYYKKMHYLYAISLKKRDPIKAYRYLANIILDNKHPKAKSASIAIMPLFNDKVYNIAIGKPSLSSKNKAFLPSTISAVLLRVINLGENRLVQRLMLYWIGKYKNYSFVLDIFSRIDFSRVRPYVRSSFIYWLGELYLQSGQKDKAIGLLKTAYLDHKRNYYSHIAHTKLINLFKDDKAKLYAMYEEDRDNYTNFFSSRQFNNRLFSIKTNYDFSNLDDPYFNKAFTLFTLGEIGYGYKVFKEYLVCLLNRPHYYLLFAKMFSKLKLHQFVIGYTDFLLDYLNGKKNKGKLIPILSEKVYPIHYRKLIFNKAKKYKIDPYLVMALIREESRFYPQAISSSGAIGLMQILPSTGKWLYNLGRRRKQKRHNLDLYHTEDNVRLGVKYLDFLFKRSSTLKSIAGYNGGPNRVRRLFRKINNKHHIISDGHFIELIDIDETRNYVKKVMNSYYVYKVIYQGRI